MGIGDIAGAAGDGYVRKAIEADAKTAIVACGQGEAAPESAHAQAYCRLPDPQDGMALAYDAIRRATARKQPFLCPDCR